MLYFAGLRSMLPVGDFKTCTESECDQVMANIMNFDVESNKSFFVTCDLKYPKSLHNLHSDFPLCPEKRKVQTNNARMYPVHNKLLSEILHSIVM